MSARRDLTGEAIDPAVHRVYRVDCEMRWESFVVAASEKEAEEIAAKVAIEDRDTADLDYYAAELKKPVTIDGASIPWGPSYWQGKQLSVNEAIDAIASGPAGVGEVDNPPVNLAILKPDPILDAWLKRAQEPS